MTLILDEATVRDLLSMRDVVSAVEECFRQHSMSQAVNSPRTRTSVPGAVLNVMHAALPYLGRAGVKCYLGSRRGTQFVFVLFNLEDGLPLAVMGADILGRYRTGAASAVATKHLYGRGSMRFAIAGSGKQAMTQVIAMKEVAKLESVNVWSPTFENACLLAERLGEQDVNASPAATPEAAFHSADVGTTITTAKTPFLQSAHVHTLYHLNVCGSNTAARGEVTTSAIREFSTIVVDDIEQAKNESGDLIVAESEGGLAWNKVVELGDVVAGRIKSAPKTLFKSNGVAIEDVAVGSLVYDNALKRGPSTLVDVDLIKGK
jgi:alanine dehydrogenase